MKTLKTIIVQIVLFGALTLGIIVGQTKEKGQLATDGCGRDCLIAIVDSYLVAIAAHDPSRLSIARNAKYTENSKVLTLGKGLWQTASEPPTAFRVYVPDPSIQEVGFLGAMKESGKEVLLALRLRIKDGQITEMEHLVARNLDAFTLPNLNKPRSAFLTSVPPAERTSRERMLQVANSYYDSIVQSNGDIAPFADDCVRRENGLQTTSNPSLPADLSAWTKIFALGCREQINTRALSYITSIELRRVKIADSETGLVYGLSMFRRPEQERTIKIVSVPGLETMTRDYPPTARLWAHVFKVQNGKIHEIEAAGGIVLPLNATTGW